MSSKSVADGRKCLLLLGNIGNEYSVEIDFEEVLSTFGLRYTFPYGIRLDVLANDPFIQLF